MQGVSAQLPREETRHGFHLDFPEVLGNLESTARSRDLTILPLEAWRGSIADLQLRSCEEILDLAMRLGDGVLYRLAMIPGGEIDESLEAIERFRETALAFPSGDDMEKDERTADMLTSLQRLQTLLQDHGMAGLRLGFLRGGALHQVFVTDEQAELAASLVAVLLDNDLEPQATEDSEQPADLTEMEPEAAADEIIGFLDRMDVPAADRIRHPKEHAERAVHVLVDDVKSLPKDKKRQLDEAIRIATRRLRTG